MEREADLPDLLASALDEEGDIRVLLLPQYTVRFSVEKAVTALPTND